MRDQRTWECKFCWEDWPYTEGAQEPSGGSEASAVKEAKAYTGEGGVLIRCHDCSAEHCPCIAR